MSNHNVVPTFENDEGVLCINLHGKVRTVDEALKLGEVERDSDGSLHSCTGGQPDRVPSEHTQEADGVVTHVRDS